MKAIIFIAGILIPWVYISCSSDTVQPLKETVQNEFIATYLYVANNRNDLTDWSENFNEMIKINPDAFLSVAYRWHIFAMDACDLSDQQTTRAPKTGYEKMLSESTTSLLVNEINSDDDRQCLGEIFSAHWQQINSMLSLNYPLIGNSL